MEVTLYNCNPKISTSTITSPFNFFAPSTPAATNTIVISGSSYSATSEAIYCPLSYELRTAGGSYGGSWISIDASGIIKVDTNTLGN